MSLEEMLADGITIHGSMSLKMVDGDLVKVEQSSKYEFPLAFMWEGRPVSVVWDSAEDEIIIFESQRSELEQKGLFEILKN